MVQSRPTFCNPVDCSPPDSSVLGILQARILEWVAMPFSRDRTLVSCIAGRFFNQLNHQRSKEMEGSLKEGSGLPMAASHCKHPGSRCPGAQRRRVGSRALGLPQLLLISLHIQLGLSSVFSQRQKLASAWGLGGASPALC